MRYISKILSQIGVEKKKYTHACISTKTVNSVFLASPRVTSGRVLFTETKEKVTIRVKHNSRMISFRSPTFGLRLIGHKIQSFRRNSKLSFILFSP